MLTILPEQIELFDDVALRRFEDEMVVHGHRFTPRLCKVLGDEQLRVALRQAIRRAVDHGLTLRGPMRLYVELMFLFGSDFDSDPQYPALRRVLESGDDQMIRAEWLYQEILDYQRQVSGPKAVNVRTALQALAEFSQRPTTYGIEGFEDDTKAVMTRMYPQKVAYVGDRGLSALILEGRAEANERGLSSVRHHLLLITLMFAFGHGCTRDPLYPWIQRTLENPRVTDPEVRASRLEKKSITWLAHVLAGRWGGETA